MSRNEEGVAQRRWRRCAPMAADAATWRLGIATVRCYDLKSVAQSQAEHTGNGGPVGRVEPRLPVVFGRYLLLQRLSRGGMGEIFLAKHGLAGFEKLAVIKKVLPHLAEDEQFISRFVDEAQVAIKLAHVNVAQVFEVGRVGDEYFLALEYVDGRDLRRTLTLLAQEKRRFPIDIALLIGRELANGLAYAHRRTAADGSSLGLVHCDISPPNVMVSFEGETKIIDFGIARSALRGTATDPKMGFGKFGYMAPEQLLRGGVVDHRTDVYAAGVVLFELLTGCRLYEPKDFTDYRALARAVAQGQHRVPSDLDPALAPCDALITTSLAPRPEDRFATAADLRDSIQLLLASVNPTVSTDQLSAVMRGLFATEMAQQRELQERIANTHLADFHEQLNTQVVPTVSFALSEPSELLAKRPADAGKRTEAAKPRADAAKRGAELAKRAGEAKRSADPGKRATDPTARRSADPASKRSAEAAKRPPESGKRAPEGARRSPEAGGEAMASPRRPDSAAERGRRPDSAIDRADRPVVRRPASAASPAAPSAAAAERRPARPEPTLHLLSPDPKSHRVTMWAIAVAAAVLVGGIVFAIIRSHLSQAPAAKIVPVVQPIEEETPAVPSGAAIDAAVAPAAGNGGSAVAPEPERPADHRRRPELTRDAVNTQFQAVIKEYNTFKAQYGMRLDGQWSDLVTFMQFQMPNNLSEGVRRMEAFRALMRSEPHK
jgi:serine/threonine protein kinase